MPLLKDKEIYLVTFHLTLQPAIIFSNKICIHAYICALYESMNFASLYFAPKAI
jgi:hypothetical protein